MDGNPGAHVARRLNCDNAFGVPRDAANESVISWSSLEKYCLRSRPMSPGYFGVAIS